MAGWKCCMLFLFWLSALVAEALVLREAVQMAVNLGCRETTFENDNLLVIEACRNRMEIGEIKGIIKDILSLVDNFDQYGFTWVGRNGNGVAHQIATLQQASLLPPMWSVISPATLVEALRADSFNAFGY